MTDDEKAQRVTNALVRITAEVAGDTLNEQGLAHCLSIMRFATQLSKSHKALLYDLLNAKDD